MGIRFRVSLNMLKTGMDLHAWRLRFWYPLFKVTLEAGAFFTGVVVALLSNRETSVIREAGL
jgi:hypothetical protein